VLCKWAETADNVENSTYCLQYSVVFDELASLQDFLVVYKKLTLLALSYELEKLRQYVYTDFVVISFLMKLFKSANTDIINDCLQHLQFALPSELIQERRNL